MKRDDAINTIECGEGIVIEIYRDDHAENPLRDFDGEAHVSIWHPRYDFGNCDRFSTPEDFEEFCRQEHEEEGNTVFRLPVFAYEHGGITVSTGAFSCPWDSGQIGWVWITRSEARDMWGLENLEKIEKNLNGTVKLLDDYLTGRVYGYVVRGAKGGSLDACWGFFGEEEESGVLDEAKSAAQYHVEQAKQARLEREARRAKCFAI